MLALTWGKSEYNESRLSADSSVDSLVYRFSLVWVECEVNMRILLLVLCCVFTFLLGLCATIGADTGKLILKKLAFRRLQKRIESQADEE